MTMADVDWGVDQWDVDATAESLNKALFGKRRKTSTHQVKVKPDMNIGSKNGTADQGQDSGDEDDDKLSKKAKKKLKERRRKENVKSKKVAVDEGNDADSNVDNAKEKKPKAKSQLDKSSSDKKKGKSKEDTKSKVKTKVKDSKILNGKRPKINVMEAVKPIRIKKEKKIPSPPVVNDADEEEGVSEAKRMKTDESVDVEMKENPETPQEGEETKPKKKRKKKKKPNSKKNKYKHLDLMRAGVAAADSDNGNESDQGSKKEVKKSNTSLAPVESNNNSSVVPEKSKKRKRSTSPEMPVKKPKLLEEPEKAFPSPKAKKQKKSLDTLPQTAGVEEKISEEKPKKLKKDKKKGDKSVSEKGLVKTSNKSKADTRTGNGQEDESNPKKLKKEKKGKKSKDVVNNLSKEDDEKESPKDTISPFFSSQGKELQQKYLDKLVAGRFRFINEQLYTIQGDDAFRMFQHDKTLMDAYNAGFQNQVKQWEVNPLDVIIKQLSNKPASVKVADFGCGEARLSASVPQKVVHSLDLHALNKRVTVCNMAKTPLDSDSIDVAVFCLSLMGTNLNDYVLEANRVLKQGGILKVAEVVSRFTNLNQFTSAVASMGFNCVNSRELSKMFYLMDFKKVKSVKKSSKQIKALSLTPCVYKKR